MAVNFLFLAVFASCGAYVAWNRVIWTLGATKANNFIYFIPLLTLFESALILGEPLTPFAGVGTILVVAGVFQASKKTEHS